MKRQIILNEKKYAEKCINEKYISDKPFYDLSILARYYYHHLGFRKKKIEQLLTQYLESLYPPYSANKIQWQETIEKIAKSANKYKLQEFDGIWVTKKELQTIGELKNVVLEKLAFVVLCLAKVNIERFPNMDGWVNDDAKEIFSLARVSDSASQRYLRLGKLKEIGLIRPSRKTADLSFQVLFIDRDGKGVLYVSETDFSELGYKYLQYLGENIIKCAECGILVRGNKNGTKRYCQNCAAYTPIESKVVSCVDCGKEFKVDSMNNRSCRCDECQKENRKAYDRKRKQLMKIPQNNFEMT